MKISDKNYLNKLATIYDKKTVSGLNSKLAEKDYIFLNHSGLVLPNRDINKIKKGLHDEKDVLCALHKLEKDLVFFATKYLGRASKNKRMLDAGSGAGGPAIIIHKKLKYKIDGYTLSEKQVNFANRAVKKYGFSNSIKLYRGNFLDLAGVPDKKFDIVWACESTEHISWKDIRRMFREFARITSPKSKVVIIAWTSRAGTNKNGKRIKNAIDRHYATDIHTKQDYINAAAKEGWRMINILNITKMTLPYWELRNKSKNATGSEKLFIEGYKKNALNYFIYVFNKVTLHK
jgi:geranyl diphosphate 2-C-methyltransferase